MSKEAVQAAREIFQKELEQDEEKVLETWRGIASAVKEKDKHVDTIETFVEKLKHLPGKHIQVSHGGGKGGGPSLSLEEANAKVQGLFKGFDKAQEIKRGNIDRLNQAFARNGLPPTDKDINRLAKEHREELIAKGRTESDADKITNTFKFRNSLGLEYQEAWEISSKDDGGPQDALQKEALNRQGGEFYDAMRPIRFDDPKMSNEHRKTAYDDIQKSTQDWFKENGFKPDDELTIYRGMALDGDHNKGSVVKDGSFRHAPLSSWTFDKKQAVEFAEFNTGFDDKKAVTYAAVVKVKDIFSTGASGIGSFHEAEAVMESSKLGDLLTVEVD